MTAAWESPVLGAVGVEPGVLAEDVAADLGLLSASVLEVTINPKLADDLGADGWAPGAREALELCRSWTEERVRVV
jgi:hypothetical protein